MRDDEGYTSTWFDEEHVIYEDAAYNYNFVHPASETPGDLYFTVESFYQIYIPYDCWDPDQSGVPLTYILVTNTRTQESWY